MPEMEIVPYERFGLVRFGATEDEVIEGIGPPDTVTPRPGARQLNYRQLGIHVTIDAGDRCESVEAGKGCVPVVDGDLRLVGSVDDVVEALRQRGFDARPGSEPRDIVCDALGVILGPELESQEVESVCAFRQDAYEWAVQL